MLTVPRELGLPVKAPLNFGTRANIEHGPLHFCLVKAIFSVQPKNLGGPRPPHPRLTNDHEQLFAMEYPVEISHQQPRGECI